MIFPVFTLKFSSKPLNSRLSRQMKILTRPKLLIIDEVGYLKLEQPEASLGFQVISQPYERQGAIVLTGNKAFSA
jgi:DNA replication protein DnaC